MAAFCGPEAAAGLGDDLMAATLPSTGGGCLACTLQCSPSLTPACQSRPGYPTLPVDLRGVTWFQMSQRRRMARRFPTQQGRGDRPGQQPDAPQEARVQDEATWRPQPGDARRRGDQLPAPAAAGRVAGRRQRCLLFGGTGSGKSATLRFVTLDLLDEDPQLADLAAHWGGRIPVWVSFPYWTSLVAREPEGVSLPECARRWLGAYGQEYFGRWWRRRSLTTGCC